MTEKQSDREKERRRDRKTERQKDRKKERQRDREAEGRMMEDERSRMEDRDPRSSILSSRSSILDPRSLRLSFSPSLLLSVLLWFCASVAGAAQTGSFEKKALSSARETPASDLDEELPDRLFEDWFNGIIGRKAGVVWQLSECGEQIGIPGQPGYDLPACAEINALLPDGRRVFVAISIGTFKKGVTGKPSFLRAVIEHDEQLRRVSRLRDLPNMLRAPSSPSDAVTKNQIANLPATKLNSALTIAPLPFSAPLSSSFAPGAAYLSQAEELPPEPPPPPPLAQPLEAIPESVSQGRAIAKVKPDYPPTAKKMNATGKVEVEIVISETGIVVEATAISGHLALRGAAVEAARLWVFEPPTINGAPAKVKSILTFFFAPSAK